MTRVSEVKDGFVRVYDSDLGETYWVQDSDVDKVNAWRESRAQLLKKVQKQTNVGKPVRPK